MVKRMKLVKTLTICSLLMVFISGCSKEQRKQVKEKVSDTYQSTKNASIDAFKDAKTESKKVYQNVKNTAVNNYNTAKEKVSNTYNETF